MALADVLRERVSRRGCTAEVACGLLGTVTVEALPPRECAALGLRDGGRALFYAACRDLQTAGETLRREGRLFTPAEVTAYVSDAEAEAAARTVLALSGVLGFHFLQLGAQGVAPLGLFGEGGKVLVPLGQLGLQTVCPGFFRSSGLLVLFDALPVKLHDLIRLDAVQAQGCQFFSLHACTPPVTRFTWLHHLGARSFTTSGRSRV